MIFCLSLGHHKFCFRVVKSTIGDMFDRSLDRALGTKVVSWAPGDSERWDLNYILKFSCLLSDWMKELLRNPKSGNCWTIHSRAESIQNIIISNFRSPLPYSGSSSGSKSPSWMTNTQQVRISLFVITWSYLTSYISSSASSPVVSRTRGARIVKMQ